MGVQYSGKCKVIAGKLLYSILEKVSYGEIGYSNVQRQSHIGSVKNT
jgi:hypothetical protein